MKFQKGQIHTDGCIRFGNQKAAWCLKNSLGSSKGMVEMHFSRNLAMKQEREKRQEFSNFILLKIIVDS